MREAESRGRRLLRRLVGAPARVPTEPGRPVALSGTEALAEAAALAGADTAASLAEGLGRSLGGARTVVALGAAELDAALPVLRQAVRLRAPLSVHLALDPGAAEPLWAVAATGAVVLMPTDVEEGFKLALAAHRVAEEVLLPVVVALDPRLAASVESVRLPAAEAVAGWLGEAGDVVNVPGLDQELLFGRRRRRVPRWHDPERPMRLGGALPAPAALASAASTELFAAPATATRLDAALADLEELTGTARRGLDLHRCDDARVVLVATGSDASLAVAVADALRRQERVRVGVVTLRTLHPFPARELVQALAGRPAAVVLERLPSASGGTGELLARVRAALDEARDNAQRRRAARPGLAVLAERDLPSLGGTGHAGLSAAAVAALARQAATSPAPFAWLGLDGEEGDLPKRQARRDRLAREVPALRAAALGRPPALGGLLPAGALSVGLAADPETAATRLDALIEALCPLLLRLAGPHLKAFPSPRGTGWDGWTVAVAGEPLRDPGDDLLPAVIVWASDAPPPADLAERTARRGALLLAGTAEALPASLLAGVSARELRLFSLDPGPAGGWDADRTLGAILRLLDGDGRLAASPRQILAARRDALAELPEAEREARLAALTAGQAAVSALDAATLRGASEAPAPSPPAWIAGGRSQTAAPAGLATFWDQVALPWRQGAAAPSPDPLFAAGAVPASSAALAAPAERRRALPSFDAELCSGCGACWTACPHGAVTARVLTAAALLDEGIRRAGEAGEAADALRMASGKLAARFPALLAEATPAGGALGPALDQAFESVLGGLPVTRRGAVDEAFRAVRRALGDLHASRTAPLYGDAEGDPRELLFLALDPDTCTACGLCVEVCEPGALALADGTDHGDAGESHRLVAGLPPPADAARPGLDALAGDLLDPVAERLLAGHDDAEPGSGERLAVRLLAGAAAARRAPGRRALLDEIGELRGRLAQAIHDGLGRALPDQDLEALSAGLSSLDDEAPLAALAGRVEHAFESERVDVVRMRRLVAAARAVADLEWRLTVGEAGGGRAPLSIVVGPGVGSWAGTFPWNPFSVPATVAVAEPAAVARGLAAAARDQAVAEARALRRAALEIERPAEAPYAEPRLAQLTWRDLTAVERSLATPVILLAAEEAALADLGPLFALLGDDLPVRAILLADLDLARPGIDPALVAASLPSLAFAQTALGFADHLAAAAALLAGDAPALVRIHAPSPRLHGFAPEATLARARQAVETRTLPLILRPAGGELDLAGNPDPSRPWPAGTPAGWAAGEDRFAGLLAEPQAGAPQPMPLESWLDLAPDDRAAATPIVSVDGRALAVAPALAAAVAARGETWSTLRRLAAPGEAAPGAHAGAALTDGDRAELERRHADAIAALEAGIAGERSTMRQDVRREAALRLRGRLLAAVLRPSAGDSP